MIWIICLILTITIMGNAHAKRQDMQKGRLAGQVIDQSTQIPLVAVNIMLEDTPLGAATDMDGKFVIKNIRPGIYNMRVKMMGYEQRLINRIVVNPNRTTHRMIELKPTVLEGGEVVVTAGYFHQARDGVVSNRSVDFEEIRSDPGSAEDIQRVMQNLPSVVSGSDQVNEIIVRGGMPGENLFVMDGIEIPNPNHFAEQGQGGGPINMLNPHFVRKIDFYAGAFPVRYGDKASSVMDIALREGNRNRTGGHGYVGMAGAGALVEGPIDQHKGAYLLSVRKSYLDLILGGLTLTAIPQYYSLQGKIVYDLNDSDKLILNGVYGDDFIEGAEKDDHNGTQEEIHFVSESNQRILGLTWRRILNDRGYFTMTASEVSNHWDVYVTADTPPELYYDNKSTETERALKTEIFYQPVNRVELNSGFGIKQVDFDLAKYVRLDTLFRYEQDANGAYHPAEAIRIYDAFHQDQSGGTLKAAGFGHIKCTPVNWLTATLGLRMDYFKYIDELAVDPRAGLTLNLSRVTHLNFAAGRHSQAPNYSEIASHLLNRDLKYKETRQAVIGLDHLFTEDIRGTVEVFYKEYQKVPVGVAETTGDPFDVSDGRGVSKGEGLSRGFELFLQKKPTGHSYYTLSYAYAVTKGRDPRDGRWFDWDYDYRHILSLTSGVQLHLKDKAWYRQWKKHWTYKAFAWILPVGDELDISCRWRYLGGRPYTKPAYHSEYRRWLTDGTVPLNGHRYPAYHRLDLRIDSRFMFDGWNIVTYLDMMNVYGQENIWEYLYQNDGTVDQLNQFSFVPIGGITVEF